MAFYDKKALDIKGVSKMDKPYAWDTAHMEMLDKEKPWENKPKFFSKVSISALAAMKILKHALAGVDKGKKAGGVPVEVMGFLIGKPDGDTVIVMDATPLPVEGVEASVVADDAKVQGYMTQLLDSMELRRREGFVGWYHSHPFDVGAFSHAHLSNTDVQTQFAFQNSMPSWTAIVCDPLRSIAKQRPEMGAFRCWPINYMPKGNEGPDGLIYPDKESINLRWGATPHRYYTLEVNYFMSNLGKNFLDIMSRNNLWIRVLGSCSILEPENRDAFPERVRKSAGKLASATRGFGRKGNKDLLTTTQEVAELAIEQCAGHTTQVAKSMLFNDMSGERRDRKEGKQ